MAFAFQKIRKRYFFGAFSAPSAEAEVFVAVSAAEVLVGVFAEPAGFAAGFAPAAAAPLVALPSIMVAYSPPSIEASNLKSYEVGEVIFSVKRPFIALPPSLYSLVQVQVSPSTVPLATVVLLDCGVQRTPGPPRTPRRDATRAIQIRNHTARANRSAAA